MSWGQTVHPRGWAEISWGFSGQPQEYSGQPRQLFGQPRVISAPAREFSRRSRHFSEPEGGIFGGGGQPCDGKAVYFFKSGEAGAKTFSERPSGVALPALTVKLKYFATRS